MCGFFAAMTHSGIATNRIEHAFRQLKHRGPDGSGLWVSEDRRWVMGHSRLSVVGLSNGRQPISSADGQVHLVANGEFYDYQKIREKLRASGVGFVTGSDSEIALHLYRQYGMQAVSKLEGEFAVLIADQQQGTMFAIRDRFGIKPLFYSVVNDDVFFASEIKSLLALGIPAVWDKESVYCESFWARSSENTLFSNIYSVPPGCFAIAKRGRVRIYPYWDWVFPSEMELKRDKRSFAHVRNEFREVFVKSINKRLVSDVEVGCYLSGGIDSCAIAGFAQRELPSSIKAFTIGFEDPAYNEAAIAQAQAKAIGADHHLLKITQQDIADAFAQAVWHAENILPNGNTVAKFLLSRMV